LLRRGRSYLINGEITGQGEDAGKGIPTKMGKAENTSRFPVRVFQRKRKLDRWKGDNVFHPILRGSGAGFRSEKRGAAYGDCS